MKKNALLILAFLFVLSPLLSQDELIVNTYNRTSTSLNGSWQYIVDPYENGYYNYRYEAFDQQDSPSVNAFFRNAKPDNPSDLIEYDFDATDFLLVPGDWNSQKSELLYYEGTVWYKKSFDYRKEDTNNRVFVHFGAANYKAEVYLNGQKLGLHVGGFTPFNFEITDIVKEKDNFLVVKVDNKRLKEGVPTLNTDWWNYGGLTRDVKLIETPPLFIQDYFIQLDPSDNRIIQGYVLLNGQDKSQEKIRLHIPGLNIDQAIKTNDTGYVTFQLLTMNIQYWSTENPYLYDVVLETKDDQVVDQIGFRTIRTSGSQILLNDKPIYLRGISIHEERPLQRGRG
ncbi:MAG: beta-glucuronidase, partial [Eudoraea sp.]|nr:beta-glucuronidase [Eudoraea sp.]